jgi:hypothetical protein
VDIVDKNVDRKLLDTLEAFKVDRKKELEDLLYTLDICKKELPPDAHSSHYDRLIRIRAIVEHYYKSVHGVQKDDGR